jgi:hypothetical protein
MPCVVGGISGINTDTCAFTVMDEEATNKSDAEDVAA